MVPVARSLGAVSRQYGNTSIGQYRNTAMKLVTILRKFTPFTPCECITPNNKIQDGTLAPFGPILHHASCILHPFLNGVVPWIGRCTQT